MSEGQETTEMQTFEITASAPGHYQTPDVIEVNARSHAAAEIYFRQHPGFKGWTVHRVHRTA